MVFTVVGVVAPPHTLPAHLLQALPQGINHYLHCSSRQHLDKQQLQEAIQLAHKNNIAFNYGIAPNKIIKHFLYSSEEHLALLASQLAEVAALGQGASDDG